MTLVLHNTLTDRRDVFEPADPNDVRMYVCGPTVYDLAHIGNARPAVIFDVLFRLLRHDYGADHVRYVRNITDIDDKIITAHRQSGEAIASITKRTADAYQADVGALNCLDPTDQPRATQHIDDMIAMIATLAAHGHAYEAEGHVLFSVDTFPDYGRLSGRRLDDLMAGARVEVQSYKRDPSDFVLWKPAADDEPGWDSPWGRGRPGWHIECSAMCDVHFGDTFDIHGGGQDLIFPHHENEIAQSTCAHGGQPLARYWVHNGFLMAEGEKMSKSLGNFYTVHELLGAFPGEAIRYALLQTQYRQPLDFTRRALGHAKRALDRFYGALREGSEPLLTADGAMPDAVVAALHDDLNTPRALAYLHDRLNRFNRADDASRTALRRDMLNAGSLLGLLQQEPQTWLTQKTTAPGAGPADDRAVDSGDDTGWIEDMIEQRTAARKARDFATADCIRHDLAEKGVILEDRPEGTLWRRV